MEIWESLQGIGAMAGLVSAAFLAFRHLTRNWPVAIIMPQQPYMHSPDMSQFVEITNPSDRPVILRFEDNTAQNELRIMQNDSVRGAIEAAMGRPAEVVLLKGQSRSFRLAKRRDQDGIDADNNLQVRFKWRFAQPFIYRRDRTATVLIRKGDYDALVGEAAFDDED